MAVYVLAYDLVNENSRHDYEPLWAELKRFGAYRVQLSLWVLSSTSNAHALCNHFEAYLDKDDRLWVSRVTTDHWYRNAKGGTNDWFKRNPVD